jgi:hypothetical protein
MSEHLVRHRAFRHDHMGGRVHPAFHACQFVDWNGSTGAGLADSLAKPFAEPWEHIAQISKLSFEGGVPVEGRERVFVKFLNNLRMPEESLHDYLILSADARRGVQLIVKKRGHDPAHVDHRERPAVPGVARYRVTRIDARATQSLESGQTRTDVNDPSRHFASAVPEAVGLTLEPLIGKTGSCHKHRLRSESDPIRTLRVQVIGSANIGPQADEGAGRSAFPLGRRCAQSRRVPTPDR